MSVRRMGRRDVEMHIMIVEENGQPEMYIECDGVRIARRGHARTWVSLEPGWVVRDHDYPNGIEVEYRDATVQ
jgi:hypothetical protein